MVRRLYKERSIVVHLSLNNEMPEFVELFGEDPAPKTSNIRIP
jgi:ABC-type lipopolysaccharide export system ATPase subunit